MEKDAFPRNTRYPFCKNFDINPFWNENIKTINDTGNK